MSAGSKTNPGGYSVTEDSLEQFTISDERSPRDIARMLKEKGYEPVWKDWDSSYHRKTVTCIGSSYSTNNKVLKSKSISSVC